MGKLITSRYLKTWKSLLDLDIQNEFSEVEQIRLEPHSFTFYTSVSVMSSSKIEGEQLEVDSFVKHKLLQIEYLPELTEKPNDLYNAYLFAQDYPLTYANFLEAHKLISAHLLPERLRGTLRKTEMLVMEHKTGRIQYEAAPLGLIEKEFEAFWTEIDELLQAPMPVDEVFYYASFIHLVFVNIHPFSDGNGLLARLLEKWFLAEKLGRSAWFIQSEKYYYKNVNTYYKNLARLAIYYEGLNYEKSIPFLLMLPEALIFEK